MKFKIDTSTFEYCLSKHLRWFDIAVYNYLADKQEIIGVYDENIKTLDKETKTYSHLKDIKGTIITNLNLGKLFCVKGSSDTVDKEINHCLKRLENAGLIKRISIDKDRKITESKGKGTTRIIMVLNKLTK